MNKYEAIEIQMDKDIEELYKLIRAKMQTVVNSKTHYPENSIEVKTEKINHINQCAINSFVNILDDVFKLDKNIDISYWEKVYNEEPFTFSEKKPVKQKIKKLSMP